jgi:hypothetical protein
MVFMYTKEKIGNLRISIYGTNSKDWIRSIAIFAETQGYSITRSSVGVVLWNPLQKVSISNDLEFVDAINVSKEFLDIDDNGVYVSLTPNRLYFEYGLRVPSEIQETRLLGPKSRPKTNVSRIINGIVSMGNQLVSTGEFHQLQQKTVKSDINIIELTSARGATSVFPATSDMWKSTAASGVRITPQQVNIHFIGDATCDGASEFFEDYKNNLKNKWSQVTKRHYVLNIQGWNLHSLLKRARSQATKPDMFSDNDIAVIAITGKKGEPLPEMQSQLMAIMDAWGQQYRLVSLSTYKTPYWIGPHLLSIVNAVGAPYALELPFPEAFDNGIFFGVDIGHNQSERLSNIVVTALTPEGRLITSVSRTEKLDESIRGDLLVEMLKKTKCLAEAKLGNQFDKAIIIRDGRLPSNNKQKTLETAENYLTALGIPTALIELRKYNNPPMTREGESGIAIGVNFKVASSSIRFATFYDSKIGLAKTFKVVIPIGGDGLGWGVDSYVNILCGLCYSPSLGSQPHLPGPIYWADGFAKTSPVNNQFRGHNVRVI